IRIGDTGVSRFFLEHHRHIAVVGILVQANAAPLSWIANTQPVVVGVPLRLPLKVESRGYRVVVQGGEDDGATWRAHHVERSPNAIINVQRNAVRRKAGAGPGKL